MLLQLIPVLLGGIALGNNIFRIHNASDFIAFSNAVNKVNNGTNYSGTTVYLDSDLSFLEETPESIGSSSNNCFLGTFDGQGYIISDLKVSSSSQFAGLFGFSRGLIIRNVVLDSSCSITSSSSAASFVGGIVGGCYEDSGQCNIENSVNMADVTFSGNIISSYFSLNLGGIAGYLKSSDYPIYVKNCANYGSVTRSGASSSSYVGGIVGHLSGSNSYYIYIHNSINYGTITHSGTTSDTLYLGGITGYSYYTYIENCVSAGKIPTQNTPSSSFVGGIVGYINSNTYINYCYYTSDLSEFKLYGEGTPKTSSYALSYDNTTFELNGTVSVGSYTGTSLIGALNAFSDYYFLCDYSKWLLNKDSKIVNFTINSRTSPITMDYQVILLPSLASEGNISFDGWYNDNKYTHPLESFEITEDKTLYGRFEENTKSYTIFFEARREGVSVAPITAQFGAVVPLPSESIRDHCSVAFWETEYGDNVGLSLAMPAHNITLYAVWKCTHIKTPDDFADFSMLVNTGIDVYNGETIYLDSDLSLPEIIEPIGNSSINYFLGMFDGQGHIISDLKMNSSSKYAGLFGYSKGLTIKNVVLDSSCSITSSYGDSSDVFIGGIVGHCQAISRECNIENSVNMAGATSRGSTSNSLFLGGIVGRIYSSNYPTYIKNCANYGSVTHPRFSSYSYIGGVVGYLSSPNSYYTYIRNSLNHGTITHSGTTSSKLYLGGITGYTYYTYIENCVSAGKVSTQNTPSSNFIGSIVGYVIYNTYINQCYYTSDAGKFAINETRKPTNITGTPNTTTPVNMTLINSLNDYASKNSTWNRWFLNTNNASVSFMVNYGKGFTVNSQVILLPDPADNNVRTFNGWYTDANLIAPFTSNQVDSSTTLYGVFCGSSNYTVTFDVNGGNELEENEKHTSVECNGTYKALPENVTRTEYIFAGWFTERAGGYKVISGDRVKVLRDHTLYAQWISSIYYTVTFDFNNGTAVDKAFNYNTSIEYPRNEDMKREGYIFGGWNGTIELMPAHDITITAQWIKASNQVEIVFNTKNLTKKDVEELLKQYTNAEFTIFIYEISDSSDEIKVIIKFISNEEADNFIETINSLSEMGNIKKVRLTTDDVRSFSSTLHPILSLITSFLFI